MTPTQRYRDVAVTSRVLAAQGPALTAILYGELADVLRVAQRPTRLVDAATRALTMIAELDAQLAGDSDFARSMRTIHRRASSQVARALEEHDPKWSQAALATISPIAEAWASLRSSA